MREMISHFEARAWIYAILLVLAQFAFLSFRWRDLINVGRRRMDFTASVQVTIASMIANMLFFTSISGIVVRIAMAMQNGVKSIFATVIDRGMTLAALILLAAAFLPALKNHLPGDMFNALCLFTALAMIAGFILIPLLVRGLLKSPEKFRIARKTIRFSRRYLLTLAGRPALSARIVLSSLTAQLCFFASIYCLILSTGTDLSFLEVMTVLPAIALVASLPVGFGGWGVREGAFIYGLGLLGVSMETSFLISVQVGLTGMAATILAGLPVILSTDADSILRSSRTVIAKIANIKSAVKV